MNEPTNPTARPLCWAYADGNCNALKKCYCKHELCSFFKTRQEKAESDARSVKRLVRISWIRK